MDDKVLLILVDGMRSDALAACGNPGIMNYFTKGSWSFSARTIFPPVTLPAHISLFHSVPPERHGVAANHFILDNHPVNGLIETLAVRGKRSAMFYSWEELRDICRPGKNLDYSWFMSWHTHKWMDVDRRATKACKEYIAEFEPDFAFLYLGGADEYGHHYGWMSPEYLNSIKTAAECIQDITEFIPENYSIIVTADHGGHGRIHGENIPEDMLIPMCFRGKRFDFGIELKGLSILDIAPTITDILGIEPDPDWEGHDILQ